MFIAFPLLAIYLCVSLALAVRLNWVFRVLLVLPLFIGGFKLSLLPLIWGGGTFISPEAPRWALLVSGACYVFLILLFGLILLRDVFGLLMLLLQWLLPVLKGFLIRKFGGLLRLLGSLGLAAYALAALATIYGTHQAMQVPDVRVERLLMPQLPAELSGLRVVVLADIHATALNDERYVAELVRRSNLLEADLVLLPGDVSDGDVALRRSQVAPLRDLKARYGVFASMGNHEYYSGYTDWLAELRSLGMDVLVNEHREIVPGLVLAGVADPVGAFDFPGRNGQLLPRVDMQAAIAGHGRLAGREEAIVLMSHQPITARAAAAAGADLQVSGHTHGGMMWGFAQLVIAPHNGGFVAGLYELDEMLLYVSRGAGLWPGFTLRLGVPGEITLLILESSEG